MLVRVTPLLFGTLLLTACAAQAPSDPAYSRYLRLGDDLASRGDPVSAGALYEKATQQPGAGVQAWLRLGQARLDGGDLRAAERAYQQALELAPDNAEALLGLGSAQLRQGRFDRAVVALSQAADAGGQPAAYSRLGIAQSLRGQADAAQGAFAKAVALAPADLDIQANQALAQALAGQGAVALEQMSTLLQSPRVQARHQRNALLIAVLAGQEARIASLPLDELSGAQRQALLQQARQVKGLADPVARARAVGLIDPR